MILDNYNNSVLEYNIVLKYNSSKNNNTFILKMNNKNRLKRIINNNNNKIIINKFLNSLSKMKLSDNLYINSVKYIFNYLKITPLINNNSFSFDTIL